MSVRIASVYNICVQYVGQHQETLDRVVLQQYTRDNPLRAEKYSFNFQLRVPNDIANVPQSFWMSNSNSGIISHRIIAYVLRHSKEGLDKEKRFENQKDLGKKLKKLKTWMVFRSEKPVIITRPPPIMEIPEYSPQANPPPHAGQVIHRNITVNEVSAMMKNVFSDGGIVKARCLFDKDVYKMGDTATASCYIDSTYSQYFHLQYSTQKQCYCDCVRQF